MPQSILTSVKKMLGLDETYTVYDTDITIHINSALGTLNQLGIGPADSFEIIDKTATWEGFLGTKKNLNAVKTYVFLKVKFVFDPPPTSFGINAMQEQILEHEWRLNVVREDLEWQDPTLPTS